MKTASASQATHHRRPRPKCKKRPRSPYRDAVSFFDVAEAYPGEAGAERYFVQQRWPNGVRCPKCGTDNVVRGQQDAAPPATLVLPCARV